RSPTQVDELLSQVIEVDTENGLILVLLTRLGDSPALLVDGVLERDQRLRVLLHFIMEETHQSPGPTELAVITRMAGGPALAGQVVFPGPTELAVITRMAGGPALAGHVACRGHLGHDKARLGLLAGVGRGHLGHDKARLGLLAG